MAVQEVAFVELQVRVAALPLVRLVGFALRFTTGAAGAPDVTVTDVVALLLPPVPVHDKVKLVVAVSDPVDLLPLVDTVPLHPPEATHDVAFVELQLMVEEPPELMLARDVLNDTVGAGVELEPPPPQAASAKDAPMVRPAVTNRVKYTCQREVFMGVSLAASASLNGGATNSHLRILGTCCFQINNMCRGTPSTVGLDLPEIFSAAGRAVQSGSSEQKGDLL